MTQDRDSNRDDAGKYSGKHQGRPEDTVELSPRTQEVRQAVRRLNQLVAGFHPGTVRIAYTYTSDGPELAYLIRHDGLTTEIPSTSNQAHTPEQQQADPRTLINLLLEEFPDPDEAVASGFATSDDGLIYLVTSRYGVSRRATASE